MIYLGIRRKNRSTSVDQGAKPRQNFVHDESWSPLDETSLRGLEIQHTRLIAKNHTNRSSARTAQRNRETGMPGEISALRDRASQWRPQLVKLGRRYDQYETRSSLFAALGGIQIDVLDVAAIHLYGLSPHVRRVQPCFVLF